MHVWSNPAVQLVNCLKTVAILFSFAASDCFLVLEPGQASI